VGTGGTIAFPRRNVTPAGPRGRVYPEPRFYGYARPRFAAPVRVYPRPYYVFTPHFSIGFGLFIGYPIAYPVAYGYPTYVYGAYPVEPDVATTEPPPIGSYGGVSLDITPDDATISVDGTYVGIVRDFTSTHQPLTLTPGRHHLELQAPDREPLAFDVDIVAGEVIPYQGAMQPS
jgi:hypothetical protein